MVGRVLKACVAAVAAVVALSAGAARASGPGTLAPWYLDQFGGDQADLQAIHAGRLGIVMARTPRPQLYIAWRLLHGQKVGPEAGKALSAPCCGGWWEYDADAVTGATKWIEARKLVPDAAPLDYVDTDREGPDYTSIATCFDEAFATAAATLTDRAQRYGAGSPEVRAWLATQDQVFHACSAKDVVLPAPIDKPPAWLKADRAYQEAAFALYDGRYDEAASRFAAIGKDKASLWRTSGPYLRARSLMRAALTERTPANFSRARAAIDDFAKLPPSTFGRGEVRDMRRILDFRERPDALMAVLEKELSQREPVADIAVSFRDLSDLGDKAATPPEMIDWMATLKAEPSEAALGKAYEADDSAPIIAKLMVETRTAAEAHALERWAKSHDPAWLVAALSLLDRGAPEADALLADAVKVAPSHPAWLTLQQHIARLTLARAAPAESRAGLDAILARLDLSVSDRNIFTAHRMQVAADPQDFLRFALRKRLCRYAEDQANPCVRDRWQGDSVQAYGIYDEPGGKGGIGFGEDARAVIDRLPLAARLALGRDKSLPAALRLDVTLTNYTRAVALREDAAADGLAGDLETLLPQMAADWRRARTTAPGSAKRFAQLFILAKIPGMRTDLVDYVRPEGTVAEFGDHWPDWILAAKAAPTPRPRRRCWPSTSRPATAST